MAYLNTLLTGMNEWSRAVVFTHDLEILGSLNYNGNTTELEPYLKAFDDRDATIGPGFIFGGESFDVHRFHPPLIYGRRGDCDVGEGISIARGTSKEGKRTYLIICYNLPIVSARAVPQQINFFNEHSTFRQIGRFYKQLIKIDIALLAEQLFGGLMLPLI